MATERSLPTSKTQFVYEWLRDEILSGSLTPGSRIRQHEVAAELGVSYTPVREAIRQLQATGLITYEPNRGNAVNMLDDEALQELYRLRGAVEGLGARLAAARLGADDLASIEAVHRSMIRELDGDSDSSVLADQSRRFHSLIVGAGGSRVILPKLQEIWTHYPVPRVQSLWASEVEARRVVSAHGLILDALRAGDGDLAGSLMESHIADSVEYRLRR